MPHYPKTCLSFISYIQVLNSRKVGLLKVLKRSEKISKHPVFFTFEVDLSLERRHSEYKIRMAKSQGKTKNPSGGEA